jgi:hypothetical protein
VGGRRTQVVTLLEMYSLVPRRSKFTGDAPRNKALYTTLNNNVTVQGDRNEARRCM